MFDFDMCGFNSFLFLWALASFWASLVVSLLPFEQVMLFLQSKSTPTDFVPHSLLGQYVTVAQAYQWFWLSWTIIAFGVLV